MPGSQASAQGGSQDTELAHRATRSLNITLPSNSAASRGIISDGAGSLADVSNRRVRRARRTTSSARPDDGNAEPRQADLPSVPDVFIQSGAFKCPWCDWSTRHSAGLMTHCTARHACEVLTEEAASYMVSLGRGTCCDCGYLRLRQGNQCGRCSSTRQPRTVRAGDAVQPVILGTVNGSDSDINVENGSRVPPVATEEEVPAPTRITAPASGNRRRGWTGPRA